MQEPRLTRCCEKIATALGCAGGIIDQGLVRVKPIGPLATGCYKLREVAAEQMGKVMEKRQK